MTQTGDAQKPASVATATTTTTVPLPAQTAVVLDEKKPGIVTLQLGAPSELKTETRTEKAEAAQSFTPPAPPTVGEVADARAKLWYRLGLAAGLAVAAFGLVRGWDFVMYGGGAVALACLCALFIQNHPALLAVIGVGVALVVVGPILWHWKLKHYENPFPAKTGTP